MRWLWLPVLVACSSTPSRPISKPQAGAKPPVADKRPHTISSPNGDRQDPYYWLRDDTRKDPAVLGYLRAENDYAKTSLAPVGSVETTLLAEMRSHIQEDDSSVPTLDDGYYYYAKYAAGQEQPVYVRKKGSTSGTEEIVLDGNSLATGHDFFQFGEHVVSRDGRYVAWVDDIVGRRQYTLHIKDLATGAILPDTAANVATSLAWANDNHTLFYTGKDASTLREDRIYRHELGKTGDKLVFQEPDASYYVSIGDTKSRRYIQIYLDATTNSEVRLVDADRPNAEPRVFLPRAKDHLYTIDHIDGHFVIRTNANAKNFRLVQVAEGHEAERSEWRDLIPARDDQLVEDFAVYHHFVAATVRTGGQRKVLVLAGRLPPYYVDANEAAATMSVIDTPEPTARKVRYAYSSMISPRSVYEVDVDTRAKSLLKQEPIPSYEPARYDSLYLHATASDGTQIPISVVFRKDTRRDGKAPVLLYGYGSYGYSIEPSFDANRLSLLDRGWIFAIAHVRGGEEMGRGWYEDGKLMHKTNTFTDFIAATEFLIAQKYGARDQMFAEGGSAGGLLMGAILNMRPDLYRGVIAEVPFVDAVTTMLDESIPLTTNEFDEWGNPKTKAAYDYMLAYSPYDNVKAQPYPSIYVRTGLWDSQVQYYEP
ncbi:MAG TPA: S9 family peptidase, partial [Kofleriaceae bacterium]|nr:S9 family peptidase [Kofleriaceae bacterium]